MHRQNESAGAAPVGSRERLLSAAAELFAARGFAGTSVELVCERAGLTKPVVYWHFGNKEGLLVATLEDGVERVIAALRRPSAVGRPGPERLHEVTERWRKVADEEDHALRLPAIAAAELAGRSERIREALRRVWQRAEDEVARGILEVVGHPLPDLDLLANTMVVLLQGVLLQHTVDRDAEALDRRLAELRRVVALGVLARADAKGWSEAAPRPDARDAASLHR
jgi:AcrR family transcriptional regulator